MPYYFVKYSAYQLLSGGGGVNLSVNTVNSALIIHRINEHLEQQRTLSPHTLSIRGAGKVDFAMLTLRHLFGMFVLRIFGFEAQKIDCVMFFVTRTPIGKINVSLIKVRCWVSLRITTNTLGYNLSISLLFKSLNNKAYI